MITIRELTKKCCIHGTPLCSRPATEPPAKDIGRLFWCELCDRTPVRQQER